MGLPVSLAAFADSDEYDPQMRASHFDGIERVGQDVGTPVIAIGDYAFFGPVISPAPKGEQAAALWDGVVALASYEGFFEIKRSRTRGPIFDQAPALRPGVSALVSVPMSDTRTRKCGRACHSRARRRRQP